MPRNVAPSVRKPEAACAIWELDQWWRKSGSSGLPFESAMEIFPGTSSAKPGLTRAGLLSRQRSAIVNERFAAMAIRTVSLEVTSKCFCPPARTFYSVWLSLPCGPFPLSYPAGWSRITSDKTVIEQRCHIAPAHMSMIAGRRPMFLSDRAFFSNHGRNRTAYHTSVVCRPCR